MLTLVDQEKVLDPNLINKPPTYALPDLNVTCKRRMLKAYIDLVSQPARAVYVVLKLIGVPHEIVPVALRKGAHLKPEYAAINPFKQVPSIDDNGFRLNESVAIIKYLCDKYDTSKHLYPKPLTSRAKIDAFLAWQHLNLRAGTGLIFKNLIRNGLVGEEPNHKEVGLGVKMLNSSLDKMESVFLKDTPFIYSDHVTIADIVAATLIMEPYLCTGLDVYKDRPKIEGYVKSVSDAVGQDLFEEANGIICRAGQVFQQSKMPKPKM